MSITKLTTNGVNGSKYDTVSADNYYMEPIATTLLAASASSIVFSNIPQGYKHLQIRYIGRSTRADVIDSLGMQFNGDTGSNYARHYLYADGTTASAGASTSQTYSNVATSAAANAAANIFGVGVIDILDYSNVYKFKTIRALSGDDRNGGGDVNFGSGLWMNTAAVTSITLLAQGGIASYVTNSRFSLYGIKG